MNPLLEVFDTPYDTTPFSKIKNEHFKPAFEEAVKAAKKEIASINNDQALPNFENTIEAMEFSGLLLNRISNIFFNLNAAETSPEIQRIAQEVSPMLSDFNNDIFTDEALFKRVQHVYKNKDKLKLKAEQETLLEKTYKSFSRNGANLNTGGKKQLRKIDRELSQQMLKFGEHVLEETNSYKLHITDEADLQGLPDAIKENAALTAAEKGLKGWVFTLDYPDYVPFMTYADNRKLRETLLTAFVSRATKGAFNNKNILLKIVTLRHQRAQLLGYKTHAHFVLEQRMAQSPEKVYAFLNDLFDHAKPVADAEFESLSAFARKTGGPDILEKWDGAYYTEKLKQQHFSLDDELLKPYFRLENVVEGLFTVAKKLYGLHFSQTDAVDTYHESVKAYEVTDNSGAFTAVFYTDFFPRAGKRSGAWMTSFKDQYIRNKNERPHIAIVCNFTKPTDTRPSLLTFMEVRTLFHEFGHALHGMLANTTYPGLSGTHVYWDFVELPSQLMENWCYEKECLDLFSKHYKTGETIPMELLQKIKQSSNFMEGMASVRQLGLALLDMAWHSADPQKIKDVKDYETQVIKHTQMYPIHPENITSCSFSHIFQGGYSSGYYSYKWAEVLDADAFEHFKENGIFNSEVAENFKNNILSQGGTRHPMTLYKQFRGKEPNPEALLKRAGLKSKEPVS